MPWSLANGRSSPSFYTKSSYWPLYVAVRHVLGGAVTAAAGPTAPQLCSSKQFRAKTVRPVERITMNTV